MKTWSAPYFSSWSLSSNFFIVGDFARSRTHYEIHACLLWFKNNVRTACEFVYFNSFSNLFSWWYLRTYLWLALPSLITQYDTNNLSCFISVLSGWQNMTSPYRFPVDVWGQSRNIVVRRLLIPIFSRPPDWCVLLHVPFAQQHCAEWAACINQTLGDSDRYVIQIPVAAGCRAKAIRRDMHSHRLNG